MPEIFQLDFMLRAFAAGMIIALVLPFIGAFLVARRYALIADSLAHVSLAGIGAGLLLGVAPLVVALPFTVAGAILLEWLRQKQRISGEVSLALLMSGGLALAVVLASMAKGSSADFSSYLFGSIATTTAQDVLLLGVIALVVILVVGTNYRALTHIAFDEASARIAGHNVTGLNYLIAALTGVMVVLSLQIVGGLLIGALLVMPVVAAGRFARSFKQTTIGAVILALVAVLAGLVLAFYVGLPAGGAIVLASLVLLVLCFIWGRH